MSWEDIIKVSPLEREIAEEYAPKDMEDFNAINEMIDSIEPMYKKVLTQAQKRVERKEKEGYYDDNPYMNMSGLESYKYDVDQNNKLYETFSQFIKDLKALKKQGMSHERKKIKPKPTYEERSKQREEVFGQPYLPR
tara:strand:- start:7495 stop:7905 length:411 start_codon:yes stop_codon:yes gene_type:complete